MADVDAQPDASVLVGRQRNARVALGAVLVELIAITTVGRIDPTG